MTHVIAISSYPSTTFFLLKILNIHTGELLFIAGLLSNILKVLIILTVWCYRSLLILKDRDSCTFCQTLFSGNTLGLGILPSFTT